MMRSLYVKTRCKDEWCITFMIVTQGNKTFDFISHVSVTSNKQADKQTNKQTNKHTSKQTHRQTKKHTNKQQTRTRNI